MLVIIAIIVLVILLIQFPPVQTWLTHKASSILSEKLQTKVEVRSVNISFFNRVVLNGVYVQDIDKDTLLYVDRLSASIDKLPLWGNTFSVNKLSLRNGAFHLKSDTTSTNIVRIVQRLSNKNKQKDTTAKSTLFSMNVKEVELQNFTFTLLRNIDDDTTIQKPNCIDFRNMYVDSIYITANNISILNDTLFFDAKSLSLKEKSGYRLHKLTSNCYIVPGKGVHFNNVELQDDYSDLKMKHFSMTYENGDEFKNFIENVVLTGDFEDTEVSFQSIGYFAAALQNIPLKITVNGQVSGPVANLKSNNLNIQGLNNTVIDGRFSITGLPLINETFIFADFKQLSTHPKDFIEIFARITGNRMESLDNFLANVNQVNFKGSFTGLFNDFVANGTLITDLGSLKLDVLFKTENKSNVIDFSGHISTPRFDAGKLLKTDLVGETSFNLITKGRVPKNASPDIFGKGTINSLVFNDYKYENIQLSGTIKENEFNGSVDVSDSNIDLAFTGKVNYAGTAEEPVPVFDFEADLKHINLSKLNFNTRDSISKFQGKVLANFKGNNITNYVGEIKLTDAKYTDIIETVDIGDVLLVSQEKDGKNNLQLQSDFIEAEYIGPYLFGEFVKELSHIAYIYAPALEYSDVHTFDVNHQQEQRYEIRARVKKSGKIARVILPGLFIAENSVVELIVDTSHFAKLHVESQNITLNNNKFDNIKVEARNVSDSLFVNIQVSNILAAGFSFQNINVNNSVHNNIISSKLNYNNKGERKNTGNLLLQTDITRSDNRLGLDVSIWQSPITINDSIWWLSPSKVIIDSGKIAINNFKFYKGEQFFTVNGIMSANINDTIAIKLHNYDLKALNTAAQNWGYSIDGNVSGIAEIVAMYNTPLIMVNINANDIRINNDTLGNITVASVWDDLNERLNITTRIYNDTEINANINGFITPKQKALQFDMQMYKLKFKFIEPLVKGIISDIHGNASGQLTLRGNFKEPTLTGKIELDQTSLLVDYLQTHYKVDATIDVEKSKISIQNGTLYDLNDNTGKLNVTLSHKQFSDINFDAFATINNMMCLNTKASDNPLFYGTAYATGGIRINGTPKDIHFNITAQANRNSKLFIPLSSTIEAKDISLLTFKSVDSVSGNNNNLNTNNPIKPKAHIDFGLDLTVNQDTEIQILIDEKAGDILRAQGQGNLKIDVDPSINLFSIVGDYQVDKGDYKFTLPSFNFIKRDFSINEGSLIKFDGDVAGAALNVQASYKARSVSLAPLLMGEPGSKSKRYPVDCQILISGKMTSPSLKFNIEIPNLDPETKAQVMSAVNTDEKMTTQFLALLAMQSFVPEQQYGNTNYGTITVLSNATDLVSGQIGNLISMLNLPVPLDVAVDVGMDDNQQISDFEVNANMMLFNRVILNGSVGNNTTQTDKQLVGDFELDVLLGTQGKYRLKVFTRSSDYFTNDLENNMQGVGISYQTEFSNFRDLFRRKKKPKKTNILLEAINDKKNKEKNAEKNNKQ